jgi:hypothetical protein
MIKIQELKDENGIDQVIIDNGDGTFTSMWKSTYDELEAAKANDNNEL